jgi:hypothetical protein
MIDSLCQNPTLVHDLSIGGLRVRVDALVPGDPDTMTRKPS